MNIDLDAIEAAAKAATPGPWGYAEVHDSSCGRPCTENGCHDSHPSGIYEINGPETGEWPDSMTTPCEADACHIALMNPETTLALVEEVRRLRELEASIMAAVAEEIRT